jgi:hypothetical protein
VALDLYREKPKEEDLDNIFGDMKKGAEVKKDEHLKKEVEAVVNVKESPIKITTRYKINKPLI